MIFAIIYASLIFVGLIITSYCNMTYKEKEEEEWQKLQEQKRIASLKIVRCRTCGAPVHITQKCSYCNHQNQYLTTRPKCDTM